MFLDFRSASRAQWMINAITEHPKELAPIVVQLMAAQQEQIELLNQLVKHGASRES